jgi:hypothetical protein
MNPLRIVEVGDHQIGWGNEVKLVLEQNQVIDQLVD